MARLKKVNLFPGYALVEEPNYEVLARCVELAKGDRSVRAFAEDCKTSGATISRIINKQISAPISDTLLMNIYKAAEKEADISLEVLLISNGYQPIKVGDADVQRGFEQRIGRAYRSEETLSELVAREVLQNELLFKGYSLELTMEPVIYAQKKDFQYRADFAFKTNALGSIGVDTWCFEVMSEHMVHSIHKMHTFFSACYLGNLSGNGKKLSLVVLNSETFKQLKERYEGIKIRDYISIILIDSTERKVVEEYNLETEEKNIEIFKEET